MHSDRLSDCSLGWIVAAKQAASQTLWEVYEVGKPTGSVRGQASLTIAEVAVVPNQ